MTSARWKRVIFLGLHDSLEKLKEFAMPFYVPNSFRQGMAAKAESAENQAVECLSPFGGNPPVLELSRRDREDLFNSVRNPPAPVRPSKKH
jgi:hypothetical protein